MDLPTSNRKKLLTFDWQVLSQKTTLFPFFGRSYLGNRSTYIAENFHIIFVKHYLQVCQISSKSEGWLANHWLIWHGMTLRRYLIKTYMLNRHFVILLERSITSECVRESWVILVLSIPTRCTVAVVGATAVIGTPLLLASDAGL